MHLRRNRRGTATPGCPARHPGHVRGSGADAVARELDVAVLEQPTGREVHFRTRTATVFGSVLNAYGHRRNAPAAKHDEFQRSLTAAVPAPHGLGTTLPNGVV